MAKTLVNTVVDNNRVLKGMQKRRNSSIVSIVGQEHTAVGGVVYFCLSPDLALISELRFKIVSTASFSNVVLDGGLSLGWSGSAGVNPDRGYANYFDLLAAISGTSYAASLFDGGVHTLTFTGGGTVKALLYAKFSSRNR